ncbi:50S ribosomal protein L3 [bacterium]|nr:50S ribosomal protein L3 [bacterium]
MVGLIGKKIGMTRVFLDDGISLPVTVIEAGPCYITQIKKDNGRDGYNAIQLGFNETRKKLITKPVMGHLEKANVKPVKVLKEFRNFGDSDDMKLGDALDVSLFNAGDVVNVTGTSKGKGFAGVMKRHGFHGGQATHGQSDRLRAPGSLGQSSSPSRVFKGMKMGGRMGGEQVTVKGLEVVQIDSANNLILVKGAIPGANESIVYIKK